MVYDASGPLEETLSVAIPGLDYMLVIGDSSGSFEFSSLIPSISRTKNIYHAKDIEESVSLMKSLKFAVVIIDGDSNINIVSVSRLIGVHNSTARIILIGSTIDKSTVFQLKNNGVIHGYISLPCEELMAHTILAQEQAKYHINRTLRLLLTDPPPGTPIRERLVQGTLQQNKRQFTLVAVSIVYQTVSRYNIILDDEFELDPVLFSSYFSAISILTEKFIQKPGTIESFEFKDQVVFLRNVDDVQYIFIFKNVEESNRSDIESLVMELSQRIFLAHGEMIKESELFEGKLEIKRLIEQQLPNHQRNNLLEADRKIQIINVHEPNPNLAEFYDESTRAYEIHYVDTEEQLFDMINDATYEIVIFNDFASDFKWNKYLLNIIKDESPHTQSIAIVDNLESADISTVLNVNDLDYILESTVETETYFTAAKKAIERSKSIQEGSVLNDLGRIYRLNNRPDLLKAMLRQHIDHDDSITIPRFFTLAIMISNEKFYTYYDTEKDLIIGSDEELLFGFIASLLSFTDELNNSPLVFSGIKYGKSNIIVKKIYEYFFIFFIGDLDQTNYDIVSDTMAEVSHEIHEVMRYDINPHVLSEGLGEVLDEICSSINTRFLKALESK
ncbi:MAG: hypothetical protein ACXAE3_07995 [Candidatus Kariarchaeaceae archaeon]|jgi:DNA-binding NarL/FixJ family response regulator